MTLYIVFLNCDFFSHFFLHNSFCECNQSDIYFLLFLTWLPSVWEILCTFDWCSVVLSQLHVLATFLAHIVLMCEKENASFPKDYSVWQRIVLNCCHRNILVIVTQISDVYSVKGSLLDVIPFARYNLLCVKSREK